MTSRPSDPSTGPGRTPKIIVTAAALAGVCVFGALGVSAAHANSTHPATAGTVHAPATARTAHDAETNDGATATKAAAKVATKADTKDTKDTADPRGAKDAEKADGPDTDNVQSGPQTGPETLDTGSTG